MSLRGTERLKLGDREYILAPEFGALDAIESRLNVGAFELLRRFAAGDWRHRDVFTVLLETSRAGGKPIPERELAEFVLADNPRASRTACEVLTRYFPQADGETPPDPPTATAG